MYGNYFKLAQTTVHISIMEDVKKWMESRLGSVPGLLAIIVTDRLHRLHSQSFFSILI